MPRPRRGFHPCCEAGRRASHTGGRYRDKGLNLVAGNVWGDAAWRGLLTMPSASIALSESAKPRCGSLLGGVFRCLALIAAIDPNAAGLIDPADTLLAVVDRVIRAVLVDPGAEAGRPKLEA
jgi:hypothetical protein